MKYGNEMGVCQDMECATAELQENLAERLLATAEMGRAVQGMAGRIRGALFGCGAQTNEENGKTPECLEEVLELHRTDLVRTARVLEETCARLGV